MEETQTGKLSVASDETFADYRVLQCENYSLSFNKHYSMLTSNHGTLFINPEGGTVIMPEENESTVWVTISGDRETIV